MWKIGYFGTTNSLPFLYGCATNAVVGGEAMLSAVKIGGFTGDNVEQLRSFVSTPSIPLDKRIYYFRECVRHPSIADISLADRALLAGSVVQCATTANDWVHALDEGISLLDPTYLHSKRRLAVMRSVVNLDLNDYDVNFVTNTINELVAYPESALGD